MRKAGTTIGGSVRSVRNALSVVEAVARHQPVALSEIAAHLDLPVTTVHRSLTTLADAGWLRQVMPGRRWVLSSHIEFVVGRSLALMADRARPALTELRTRSGESSMYAVADGDHMVVVVAVDSDQSLRFVGREGSRHPLHLLSTGKAVLASWSHGEIRAYADRVGLDADELVAECARTRAAGFAVNLEGWEQGLASVSVTIPTTAGTPTAAVGVFGPIDRFEGRIDALAALVGDASRALTDQPSSARAPNVATRSTRARTAVLEPDPTPARRAGTTSTDLDPITARSHR